MESLPDSPVKKPPARKGHQRNRLGGSVGSNAPLMQADEPSMPRNGSINNFSFDEPTLQKSASTHSLTPSAERQYAEAGAAFKPELGQVSDWVLDVLDQLGELSEAKEVVLDLSSLADESRGACYGADAAAAACDGVRERRLSHLSEAVDEDAESPGRSPSQGHAVATHPAAPSPAATPRTTLHDLAYAWSASVVKADDADLDVDLEKLLKAFELSATVVGGAIGAVMAPSVKNDNGNLSVLSKVATKFRVPRLRGLLRQELNSGVHKTSASAGHTLRDPSAALAAVWLRRSLALQTGILAHLASDRSSQGSDLPMSAIVTHAYADELERFHNWMLRGTMKVAFNAAPSKDVVLRNLQGSTPKSPAGDGYATLFEDVATLVEAQKTVAAAMASPLVDLDLDRSK